MGCRLRYVQRISWGFFGAFLVGTVIRLLNKVKGNGGPGSARLPRRPQTAPFTPRLRRP